MPPPLQPFKTKPWTPPCVRMLLLKYGGWLRLANAAPRMAAWIARLAAQLMAVTILFNADTPAERRRLPIMARGGWLRATQTSTAYQICHDTFNASYNGAPLCLVAQLARTCPKLQRLALMGPIFTSATAAFTAKEGLDDMFGRLLDIDMSVHGGVLAHLCQFLQGPAVVQQLVLRVERNFCCSRVFERLAALTQLRRLYLAGNFMLPADALLPLQALTQLEELKL